MRYGPIVDEMALASTDILFGCAGDARATERSDTPT